MIHALHGNFGLPSDWDAALPLELPSKKWHLWEIRRHHPETHSLGGFATWFNNQIAELPPDPQRLLAGYSLGGRLALHILTDRPALWSRTLLLSTHPGLITEAERDARLAQDALWQQRCLTTPWSQVQRAWNAQPVLQNNGLSSDLTPLSDWHLEIASSFDGWSLGRQADTLSTLASLPCSGLWLAGANDPKFSQLAVTATQSLVHFERHLILQAGHRLLIDNPLAIQSSIRRLLR